MGINAEDALFGQAMRGHWLRNIILIDVIFSEGWTIQYTREVNYSGDTPYPDCSLQGLRLDRSLSGGAKCDTQSEFPRGLYLETVTMFWSENEAGNPIEIAGWRVPFKTSSKSSCLFTELRTKSGGLLCMDYTWYICTLHWIMESVWLADRVWTLQLYSRGTGWWHCLKLNMASPSPTFSMMNTAANESQTIPEEEYLEEVKENLQGPHDWRKRLKPVCRQSSQEDPSEIQGESEGSSGTGKSPSDK